MKLEKPIFKIRSSATHDIMAGTIGLSESQQATLDELESREKGTHPKGLKLTANMVKQLIELRHKQANPELPDGAKSYVIKWVKQYRWKRYKELKSKYVRKGNAVEQDGFNLMVSVLKTGMVRSETKRFSNSYSNGICDLHLPHLSWVIDNKASWDWESFPFLLDELPKKDARYYDQIQSYLEGYDAENGSIVYTLVDCPIEILSREIQWEPNHDKRQETALNLVYTRSYWDEVKATYFPDAKEIEFVEIPEAERVKEFKFKRDRAHAAEVEKRVKMCQELVDKLWDKL